MNVCKISEVQIFTMTPFTHRTFPRAILHVDGDSFFASCEIAKDPKLRGKLVITGKERGIVSSMSYEAKSRGVTRAMKLSDVRKLCPDAVILPSDYETYSLYSKRMYEIVRRYTPDVEEYSIDECFADLSGMRRVNHMSYEDMSMRIKHELDSELGMTFSVGLSVNKVSAKIASKWRKPSGLTIIPANMLHIYESKLPIGKVWGIGSQTSAYANKLGIFNAYDFAMKDMAWIADKFSKPFVEIWRELRGEYIQGLTIGEKHDYASISKTKTFTPPSTDKSFVYSQLSKNVENVCIKLRRHELYTSKFAFFLKTQNFNYSGLELKLAQSVSTPQEILEAIEERFDDVWRKGVEYRATGIVLMDISHATGQTNDLFGYGNRIERMRSVYGAVDRISEKYGKHSVFLGSSFRAINEGAHRGDRSQAPWRHRNIVRGEGAKRIAIPFLGKVN